MSNIPSDKDFARAKRLAMERAKNIGAINEAVMKQFHGSSPLHYFILMPQRDNEFWAGVFYEKESDISVCETNGLTRVIQDFVYSELERQGRGGKDEVNVVFEIDSDEHVNAKYGGDYFLRLR
jgi:hypothetical protein